MFIILVMILILIGMLVLCTLSRKGVPLRRRTPKPRDAGGRFVARPENISVTTPDQTMLTPSTPQASAPGSSPESASVGADVPVLVQATSGSPPPQDHPGGVPAATGSQSIATSTERNTFGAGADVAGASSVSPGPVRGPLVGGVDSGTDHDPDAVDDAAKQLVIELVIAQSNVGTADDAAE